MDGCDKCGKTVASNYGVAMIKGNSRDILMGGYNSDKIKAFFMTNVRYCNECREVIIVEMRELLERKVNHEKSN